MASNKLSYREELDFHYLLGLMPPLHNIPEFAWLPELFSIIGHEKLILLSKYAGGETITIPTLNQILSSIEALQLFYDINISGTKDISALTPEHAELYWKIVEVSDARNNK